LSKSEAREMWRMSSSCFRSRSSHNDRRWSDIQDKSRNR